MFKAILIVVSQQELLSCCFCDHVSPNISKLWLLLCFLRVPLQLASPPGFHVTHIPKGNLVLLCTKYKCVFLHFGIFSIPAVGLFSCSLLGGTQGARPDPARKFGPWPRSAACALGFKVASPLGEGFRARRTIQAPANPRTR